MYHKLMLFILSHCELKRAQSTVDHMRTLHCHGNACNLAKCISRNIYHVWNSEHLFKSIASANFSDYYATQYKEYKYPVILHISTSLPHTPCGLMVKGVTPSGKSLEPRGIGLMSQGLRVRVPPGGSSDFLTARKSQVNFVNEFLTSWRRAWIAAVSTFSPHPSVIFRKSAVLARDQSRNDSGWVQQSLLLIEICSSKLLFMNDHHSSLDKSDNLTPVSCTPHTLSDLFRTTATRQNCYDSAWLLLRIWVTHYIHKFADPIIKWMRREAFC